MTAHNVKAFAAEDIERIARAFCPFKGRPCPGSACYVCANKARDVIVALQRGSMVLARMKNLRRELTIHTRKKPK